jgi:uncharacterized protein
MATLGTLRRHLKQVLHLEESPHRIALSFAIGVFIAFAPHYLFHTASVILVAWAFRLNYLAMLVGSLINNPWTLIPILAASLYTGLIILGESLQVSLDWNALTPTDLFEMIGPYLLPFIVGASTLAILGGLAAYPIMRWTVTKYRKFKTHRQP